MKEIDFFDASCYRYMLYIKRIDRVGNEKVLQRVRRSNLINLLFKHQPRSLGHWIRKDVITTCFALYIKNNKRDLRGRLMLNYKKHIDNITSITTPELKRKALNREKWRRDVVGRFHLQPPGKSK